MLKLKVIRKTSSNFEDTHCQNEMLDQVFYNRYSFITFMSRYFFFVNCTCCWIKTHFHPWLKLIVHLPSESVVRHKDLNCALC